jgi:hypothetical protein
MRTWKCLTMQYSKFISTFFSIYKKKIHKIRAKFISAARARQCSFRVAFGLCSVHHNTSLSLISSGLSQDDLLQNKCGHFEPAL